MKYVSKIKRSLPGSIQKYADKLIWVPQYVRCGPSNQVIY